MTLNLIVRMSKNRGLTINPKRLLLLTLTKNFEKPVKTLPCVLINSKDKLFRDEFKIRKQKFLHHMPSSDNLPLLLIAAIRVFVKLYVAFIGRRVRKWWSNLSPEEKNKIKAKILSQKTVLASVGVCFLGAVTLYYYAHIEYDPITKRKRFIMFSKKRMNQVAEYESKRQRETYKHHIVPYYHPLHRRVTRVINNLLLANSHIPELRDKMWTVTVVDKPEITNAFALPNGQIFVFTGMLNVCTNDDQLAIVLAHEVTHTILFHIGEIVSQYFFLEFFLLIPSVLIWSVFSGGWAIFSEWMMDRLSTYLIYYPFNRSLESEADYVGLQLAARSCYDVREAPIFWGKMKYISTKVPSDWFSTHPSPEKREQELRELMPEALEVRNSNNCPPLPPKRLFFSEYKNYFK